MIPAEIAAPSRKTLRRSAARLQQGMTLLEIMIVLAILALVMGLVVGPRVMKMFGESKVDIAKLTVTKFANEAFPQWSRSHPGLSIGTCGPRMATSRTSTPVTCGSTRCSSESRFRTPITFTRAHSIACSPGGGGGSSSAERSS